MSEPNVFSTLYVVSDLHLGGEAPSPQMFRRGTEFATLIDHLLSLPAQDGQALVINGDLVDFLAEPDAEYFDALSAVGKLERIFTDPAFEKVWLALRTFVAAKDRSLIITLGNHDLELSLPAVQRRLLQELSQGNASVQARITLAFDHEGYRARVGSADVLCVHGNEVDLWNLTDYEQLRRIARDVERGVRPEKWVPNAGTRLVIDAVNAIKARYAFVDLLKPEGEAMLPTLLVLDPQQAEKIANAIPAVLRLGYDSLRRAFHLLGPGEAALPTGVGDRSLAAHMLGAMLERTFEGASVFKDQNLSARELLRRAEEHWARGMKPADLLAQTPQAEFLGLRQMILNIVGRKGKSEVLREALEQVRKDTSFDVHNRDETFLGLKKRIPAAMHFVTAGHTHLERAIPLGARRCYFNSGTWARLIQLKPEMLDSPTAFQPVFAALDKGHMADLDALPGLVLPHPTVVAFWADDKGTHGELRHLVDDRLEAVKETHFVRTGP